MLNILLALVDGPDGLPLVTPRTDELPTSVIVVVVGMVITAGITMGTAIITYLAGRDKLKFDAEVIQLRRDVGECVKVRSDYQDKINQLETKLDQSEKIAARQEGELVGYRREIEELRQEVRELRDRLYGGGGGKPS